MELPERIAKMEAVVEGIKEDVAAVKQDIKELHLRVSSSSREITDHIDDKIDALARADIDQHSTMSKKIDFLKERIDILEKWRWMIVGGAIALGYFLSNTKILGNFIK